MKRPGSPRIPPQGFATYHSPLGWQLERSSCTGATSRDKRGHNRTRRAIRKCTKTAAYSILPCNHASERPTNLLFGLCQSYQPYSIAIKVGITPMNLHLTLAPSLYPRRRHDQANSSYFPIDTAHNTGQKVWNWYSERGGAWVPLIGADGTLFVNVVEGSIDARVGRLYALDAAGNVLGCQSPEGVVGIKVIDSLGRFYGFGDDRHLYALSSAVDPIWKTRVPCDAISDPVFSQDRICVVSGKSVLGFDADGRRVWRTVPGLELECVECPAVGPDGTLYVVTEAVATRIGCCAIDPIGTLKWVHEFGVDYLGFLITTPPVILPDGRCCVNVGTAEGPVKCHLFGPEGATGEVWEHPVHALGPDARTYGWVGGDFEVRSVTRLPDGGPPLSLYGPCRWTLQCRDADRRVLWDWTPDLDCPEIVRAPNRVDAPEILAVTSDGSVYVRVDLYDTEAYKRVGSSVLALSTEGRVRWVLGGSRSYTGLSVGPDGTLYTVSYHPTDYHNPRFVLHALR